MSNRPGRWTAESRLAPFKEPLHHFFCPRVNQCRVYLAWTTMCVCLCVRVLWIKTDSQTPRRDPAHSGRWPEKKKRSKRNDTMELANWPLRVEIWPGKCVWTKCVSVCVRMCRGTRKETPVYNYFLQRLAGCFCFPVRWRSLLLMRSDQWAHSEASKQREEETDKRHVCIAPRATFCADADFFYSSCLLKCSRYSFVPPSARCLW